MNLIVLNSGSNGNAVYVESTISGTAVLLDCGISRKRIEQRLKASERYLRQLRAVFITHEHADHVLGLATLIRVTGVPVYATSLTCSAITRRYPVREIQEMKYGRTIRIDDLEVSAFPKSHDAVDAVFFLVRRDRKSFLYATDLGIPGPHLIRRIARVNALMLESNYDEEMLWKGRYPAEVKERIHSPSGHLSNRQSMDLIERYCDGSLRTLILGHISKNNNSSAIVRREYESMLMRKADFKPRLYIASRHEASEVIRI